MAFQVPTVAASRRPPARPCGQLFCRRAGCATRQRSAFASRRACAAFVAAAPESTHPRKLLRRGRGHRGRCTVRWRADATPTAETAVRGRAGATSAARERRASDAPDASDAPTYDVAVIGSGIGALTAAAQLAAKGAHVVVFERYLIPGGSSGYFTRGGYTFDVGASMIFGFGERGYTNLLTRALAAVGEAVETIPDPVQINYHLPGARAGDATRGDDGTDADAAGGKLDGLRVHRDYDAWIGELAARFPHERVGIRRFYDECWRVFRALDTMELLSLEEPRYLLRTFVQHPLACFTLLRYVAANAGDIARRHISDVELLQLIDMECYCWSVAPADRTPMINAGMVFSDRHYGGINYPVGGVGRIAQRLVAGLERCGADDAERAGESAERGSRAAARAGSARQGEGGRERGGGGGANPGSAASASATDHRGRGRIEYRARVIHIEIERNRARAVRLADGRRVHARAIISNATRWDTFGSLVDAAHVPHAERLWRARYAKSPSFLSLHLGVRADALRDVAALRDCHHIVLDEWREMESAEGARGTIFVSIPSVLDASVAPPGRHVFHVFTPSWLDEWRNLGSSAAYERKKRVYADHLIRRLEERVFPNLANAIELCEVGTPRTHRRFLGRADGSYGPVPRRRLPGLLGMPFNKTAVDGLYCVGDSTFPGQGLNAVAFSGFACAQRVAVDLGLAPSLPGPIDRALTWLLARKRLEWLAPRAGADTRDADDHSGGEDGGRGGGAKPSGQFASGAGRRPRGAAPPRR